jgi:hypothetical protein
MEIIGRSAEKRRLEALYNSKSSEFLVVYGRRRVGKTYLIRQHFEDRFTFITTGMYKKPQEVQLTQFAMAISEYFEMDMPSFNTWLEAFAMLKKCLQTSKSNRKVVFIDEISWFDTTGSDFIGALEWFWNGWAASQSDIFLITCGSATSWITDNLLADKGGLFNRVTCQMYLLPFTLHETEQYLQSQGINWSRYDITECYMALGGIPYYLKQLDAQLSYTANIDELFFKKNGRLKDEFDHLYKTLFENSAYYIKLVEVLSGKTIGLTRDEISVAAKVGNNGLLSKALRNLVNCNIIRGYNYYGKAKNGIVYQLSDYFTMFYFAFIKQHYGRDEHFWTLTIDHPARRTWAGNMFEQVCKDHIAQIKRTIGIFGVVSEQSTWYVKPEKGSTTRGAQIDLLISRRDRVINVCEMKFSQNEYVIDADYEMNLRNKLGAFRDATKTHDALNITMITTYGVKANSHSSIVQSQITLDDLFQQ